MTGFGHIVRRDLELALRRANDTIAVVLFFVLAIVLFPLGVGPELSLLARIAAGTIWVAALLAAMLSLDRLFQADFEDGSLDLLVLAPVPLELVVLAKCLAHWLTTGVPLIVVAPLLAVLMNMDWRGFATLEIAMLLGTPVLSLIGAIGAALTVGARRGGVLVPLLVLPLMTPVLIFGVSAVEASLTGLGPRPHLMILGGMLLGALFLSPWAAAAGLRLALE
ncbi:MAG: heme exporter protein CcmB [Alphaproteobacteria bacterium]|jgi:heme exporter protein B|nr:heme exporter protein CcmB [Alphaproteobacteria bacterium]MDP6518209.1 heme exporter protein CcmB [Alphaproteobacteria bacterium]|tara:strand:+ start:157 stop:822 length:666 start_codon:yes stop_codon:yes gene_type:complete